MHDQRTIVPGSKDEARDGTEVTQRNDILGLRALLFSEIRSLGAKVSKEQLEVARVKTELAQTIINSVKAEINFRQAQKASGAISVSGFIPIQPEPEEPENT